VGNSGNEIVLEYDNHLSDHLKADRLYYSTTALAKVDKVVSVVLALTGVGMITLVGFRWWFLLFFLLAFCEWFNVLSPRPLQIRIAFKRIPKFRERYLLIFNEEGIHFKTSTIDTKLAWRHYNRLIEDDRLFLLVYARGMYTVIPKSAFPDRGEIEQFRELVGKKLGTGS
jgi:hypothetical protein